MPAPQAQVLSQLTKTLLQAKAISVPASWDSSLEDKFNTKTSQFASSVPNPMDVFVPPSPSQIAVNACDTISGQISDFIDAICSAICQAWASWQSASTFTGVIINAGLGMCMPGGLVAGPVTPLIMASFTQTTPSAMAYATAIAQAIGMGMTTWQTGYTNPLIPFPGGMVASTTMVPSPNVPLPVATGQSPGDALLQASPLMAQMLANYGPPQQFTEAIFDALSQAFAQTFTLWKASTMISNILGAGGVAPPPPSPPGPVAGAIGVGGTLA